MNSIEKEDFSNEKIEKFGSGCLILASFYMLKENVPADQVIEKVNRLNDSEIISEIKRIGVYDIWLGRIERIGKMKRGKE